MSTVEKLERFLRELEPEQPPRSEVRAQWGDALATFAAVTLASTLVFEILRALLN